MLQLELGKWAGQLVQPEKGENLGFLKKYKEKIDCES